LLFCLCLRILIETRKSDRSGRRRPLGWVGTARAELGFNFPEPAAGVAQEIYDIHMLTTTIATVLLVIIFGFVATR
jgi:hypothetical protein